MLGSRLYATASRPSRVIGLEFRRVLEGAPRRPSTVNHLSVAVRGSSVDGAFAGRRRSCRRTGLERATSSSAANRGWRTTARCECICHAFLFALFAVRRALRATDRPAKNELPLANAARSEWKSRALALDTSRLHYSRFPLGRRS